MSTRDKVLFATCLLALAVSGLRVVPLLHALASPMQQAPAPSAASIRQVGTVKAIDANNVILTTDSGAQIKVLVQQSTRLLRVAPGQKNLKEATPIGLPELQPNDRVLVLGKANPDGATILASSVVVMKRADIVDQQEQERADWQKRGVGGLVSAVDPAGGVVTISTMVAGAPEKLLVHISKNTVVLRYAPDSVRFDDAKPGTLSQIQPGDQLRARGTRSPDDHNFSAEAIVSGTFLSIAGTVNSVDPAANTINVTDLRTKRPISLKVSSESQLKKLPPMLARVIAIRLKGGAFPLRPGAFEGHGPAQRPGPGAAFPGGDANAMQPRTAPDLQQVLNRLPALALTDLQKGEAVMLVASPGNSNTGPKLITLLAGVEPILTASPKESGAMLLSPWNLGSSMGDAATPAATP